MILHFSCTKCGCSAFRIYISRDLAECHECLERYKLSEVADIKVEHQR